MVGKTKRPDRSGTAKGDGSPDKSAETERSGKRQHVEEKSRTSLGGRGGAAEDPPRVVAAGGMVVSLLSSAVPVGSKVRWRCRGEQIILLLKWPPLFNLFNALVII